MSFKRARDDDGGGGTSANQLLPILNEILGVVQERRDGAALAARECGLTEALLKAIDCNVPHKKSKSQSNDCLNTGTSERLEDGSVEDKLGTKDPEYFGNLREALREILKQFYDDRLKNCSVHDGTKKYWYNEKEHENVAGFRRCLDSLDPKSLFVILTNGEELVVTEDKLKSLKRRDLLKGVRTKFQCGKLLDLIRDKGGSSESETYISGLVEISSETNFKGFSEDWSKDAAYVISGESGSGKSAFVQNEFQSEDSACIYHSLDRNDINWIDRENLEAKPNDEEAVSKLRELFHELFSEGLVDTDLYMAVSTVHSKLHRRRNEASVNILKNTIEGKVDPYPEMKAWWNGTRDPIEKLVVIIDEAGKCESFARGLVDSVREIHKDFIDKNRCKKFKLVIAGSGLDAAIKRDSLLDPVDDPDMATFGTDPQKSNVIVLKGPKKTSLQEKLAFFFTKRKYTTGVQDFIPKAIADGIYSNVLATNTRMLFDGIIPILEDEKLTSGIEKAGLGQRLHDLCSSNIIMDYAARTYAQLNGLKDLSQDDRQELLSRSFLYLLKSSYKAVKNEHAYAIDTFDSLSVEGIAELTLKGLVASNPLDTSPALRYLACNGHSEELIPADGISFEALIAAHLRRFEYASKGCSVVLYTLQEAWPGKALAKLRKSADLHKELIRNFEEYSLIDVRNLIEIIQENGLGKLAIVMRQRVPSAQSADVIVLGATVEEKKVELCFDLFQAKHYTTIPGVKSDTFRDWVKSIGVNMGGGEDYRHEYSQLGIEYLGNCLEESLRAEFAAVSVVIRGRFLVVSKGFNDTPWEKNVDYARDYNVTLWTRESLEPTFSAINLDPPVVEGKAPSVSSIDDWMKTKE